MSHLEHFKASYHRLLDYFTHEKRLHPLQAHRLAKDILMRPPLYEFAVVPLMTFILPPNIPNEIGYMILKHLDDHTLMQIAKMGQSQ